MITIEDVYKTYISGEVTVEALKGVSLTIKMGESIALAGSSGSGKTTLLNLIGCIDTVNKGKISIEEKIVTDFDEKDKTLFRRENLGFIFQSYNLVPVLTAYENVAFALELLQLSQSEVTEKTNHILKQVGLEGMEKRFPVQLSGGQQQRVAIARALVKEPKILLADEPTANLDSKTGEEILELITRLNEEMGTTVIIATHDDKVMSYAKRLVKISDGVVQSDTQSTTQE